MVVDIERRKELCLGIYDDNATERRKKKEGKEEGGREREGLLAWNLAKRFSMLWERTMENARREHPQSGTPCPPTSSQPTSFVLAVTGTQSGCCFRHTAVSAR